MELSGGGKSNRAPPDRDMLQNKSPRVIHHRREKEAGVGTWKLSFSYPQKRKNLMEEQKKKKKKRGQSREKRGYCSDETVSTGSGKRVGLAGCF